ncbi:MAG TPA: nuclear transport factor 2 family protein, partial [Acidimicrobiia bacterium]
MIERTEESRRLMQALYDAVSAGDLDGVLNRLADDVVIREPAFLPYGGEYRGKELFGELVGKIAKTYDMTQIRADYLVADGERVIGLLRMPDLATGEDVLVAEESVIRDGKVVQMTVFVHDAQSLISAP